MNSIDLTKLMQEAGVEQDVIDAACQKNNELLQTELKKAKEQARKQTLIKKVKARVSADRDEAIEQILASKPKIVSWSDERDDGRQVKFGRAGLDVDEPWALPKLRRQASLQVPPRMESRGRPGGSPGVVDSPPL